MANHWDIALIETGGGGDFTLLGNDLAVDDSISTAVYLAMFGGNVEADTNNRIQGVQYFDYWGNIFIDDPILQFNSDTERTLNKTPLTSAGRIVIENAIKKDLSVFSPNNSFTVSVAIVSTDKINVTLKIIMANGTPKVKTFSLIRGVGGHSGGDFYLGDFNFNDFF